MDGTIEYPLFRPDELADEAWAAMDRQDVEAALRAWEALREHSPERPEGHIWPIQLLWQEGRFGEAEAMAARAHTRFPDHPELLIQRAWTASAQRDWPLAAERWAAVRAASPERLEGYVWGARALWQSNRLGEAEAVATEGVQRFPDEFDTQAEHAWVATTRQDWAQALRRWTLVNDAHPGRPDAQARLVQALRMTGRGADSETLTPKFLAEHPDSTELLVEHIWTAAVRGDWATAANRLDAAYDRAKDPARIAESLGEIEAQIHTHAAEPAADAGEIAPSDLMLSFESIGEKCDFGAVQRFYGIEPLGLLRFAWSKHPALIAALADRFSEVGTEEDTSFERFREETIVWMRKYQLLFHTFVDGVHERPPEQREVFYQQQRRRLVFLKDKLIRDLEDPQKILVYATSEFDSDAEVAQLFAALRQYGPNRLLYVRPEREGRPVGTVEVLDDGLYAGYFHEINNFMEGNQPPFQLWLELCRKTYQLANGDAGDQVF